MRGTGQPKWEKQEFKASSGFIASLKPEITRDYVSENKNKARGKKVFQGCQQGSESKGDCHRA